MAGQKLNMSQQSHVVVREENTILGLQALKYKITQFT